MQLAARRRRVILCWCGGVVCVFAVWQWCCRVRSSFSRRMASASLASPRFVQFLAVDSMVEFSSVVDFDSMSYVLIKSCSDFMEETSGPDRAIHSLP